MTRLVIVTALAVWGARLPCAGGRPRTEKEQNMIPEDVRNSLAENGFDCCWYLSPADIGARSDSRVQLGGLVAEAEQFVREVFKAEWLPRNGKDFLVPVRGGPREPDRLLQRYKAPAGGHEMELVCGEFSVTLNAALARPAPVAGPDQAMETYRDWAWQMIRADGVAVWKLESAKIGSYWKVVRVFQELERPGEPPQVRYTPWSWPESVRTAIDRKGNWVSVSVLRLPDRMDSMPKGGAGRSRGSWFDAYIASLSPAAPKP